MNIQISSIRNKISIQLKPKVESKIYFKDLLSTPIESIFNLALSFLMHKVESICRDHFNTQTHFCHLSPATHFPKSFFPELFMLCWGKGVTDFTLWFFFVLLIWRWFKYATDYSRIIIMHTTAKGRSVWNHAAFPLATPPSACCYGESKQIYFYSCVHHFLCPSLLLMSENFQRGHFSSSTSRTFRISFNGASVLLTFYFFFLLPSHCWKMNYLCTEVESVG